MMRMKSLHAVFCVLAAFAALADSLDNIGTVKLKGPLGERLDRMIRGHVIGTDVDYITAPFMEKTETKNWWQTEFWGKWMHSAVPYAWYNGDDGLAESIERGIDRMLASQEGNGYIGNYPDALRCGEGWDVWGIKYTMMGLLHYHDLKKRLADSSAERADLLLRKRARFPGPFPAAIVPLGRRQRRNGRRFRPLR